MFAFLPGPIKGILSVIFLTANTVFWCVLIYFFTFLKFLSSRSKLGDLASVMAVKMALAWSDCNFMGLSFFHHIRWQVDSSCQLDFNKSYLVCCNHISFVDIVVLMQFFNHRIPFLRFFIKRDLLYVPFLGIAWWALDYPFMKRHSAEYLAKHPEKRNEDLETTRRSCERFRGKRISMINFLEGTRFKPAKRDQQKSPYRHLLKPKAGGMAFVLEAMGEQFHSLLDVTICYPQGPVSFWGLLCGKLDQSILKVDEIPIPREFLGKSYFNDPIFHAELQAWLKEIWQRKDDYLEKCVLKSIQHK